MKKYILLLSLAALIQACTSNTDTLESKVEELKKYKGQLLELNNKIKELETEIAALDPEFADDLNGATLITTIPVSQGVFTHKIEVRGNVASRRNVIVSTEIPGRVVNVRVKEGDKVNKGQLIAELDAESIRKGMEEIKTSMELAQTVFERQSRLWDQKIGTEIQYLQAKNNVENLQRRLESLETELAKSNIRAPISGTVDLMAIRIGEVVSPGMPIARITSTEDMYVLGDVSEQYIGKFKAGDLVEVYFPSLSEGFESSISAIGTVINPNNRTYNVEVALPTNAELKPNMQAVLKLIDYQNSEAFIIPTYLIQTDRMGKYVWALDAGLSQTAAKKLYILVGETYQERTEILQGINGTEILVDKGFRDMSEGAPVRIASINE
jgi:membrane fusion protein, multidrug efflux system